MTKNERIILQAIAEIDGQLNWYKLGRKYLPDLDMSENFGAALSRLVDSGLVLEKLIEGEPLPRLKLTDAGRAVLIEPSI
jgi:hypothetical protein